LDSASSKFFKLACGRRESKDIEQELTEATEAGMKCRAFLRLSLLPPVQSHFLDISGDPAPRSCFAPIGASINVWGTAPQACAGLCLGFHVSPRLGLEMQTAILARSRHPRAESGRAHEARHLVLTRPERAQRDSLGQRLCAAPGPRCPGFPQRPERPKRSAERRDVMWSCASGDGTRRV
jgi:hypothetical protein